MCYDELFLPLVFVLVLSISKSLDNVSLRIEIAQAIRRLKPVRPVNILSQWSYEVHPITRQIGQIINIVHKFYSLIEERSINLDSFQHVFPLSL